LRKGNNSLKFDVIIKNYQWQSASSDSLILTFKHDGGKGDYFIVEETANNGTVSVTLDDKGNKKYVRYDKFSTPDLVHDPEFGINAASSTTSVLGLLLAASWFLYMM
jgi:hypothetical protein